MNYLTSSDPRRGLCMVMPACHGVFKQGKVGVILSSSSFLLPPKPLEQVEELVGIAVGARQCPQGSGTRSSSWHSISFYHGISFGALSGLLLRFFLVHLGWGPAAPTEFCSSGLRSRSAPSDAACSNDEQGKRNKEGEEGKERGG